MRHLVGTMVSVLLLASLLAGCAAPTPQVIEKEKVVEKPVVQTVVVEKEKVVEKPVVQTVVVEKAAPGGVQEWELVNPAGAFRIEPAQLAPRPTTLDGKTIVLRWNNKPGGDFYLDRVAELLAEKVPTAKVIKAYEVDPATQTASGAALADKLAALGPDIVIASQAD